MRLLCLDLDVESGHALGQLQPLPPTTLAEEDEESDYDKSEGDCASRRSNDGCFVGVLDRRMNIGRRRRQGGGGGRGATGGQKAAVRDGEHTRKASRFFTGTGVVDPIRKGP